MAGTADDPTSNPDPVIDHVEGPDDCPAGTTFSPSICACAVDNRCQIDCPQVFPGFDFQNPLEICECIQEEDYNAILDHGLDGNCMEPDDGDDSGLGLD